MIRVVIAEDNSDMRELLAGLLDAEPDIECVGTARRVQEVWPVVLESSAEIVVLDLQLGGESAISLLRDRPSDARNTRVIAFSGFDEPQFVAEVLAAGATEFVVKTGDAVEKLLAAVRRCARQKAVV
jgi:two-component system, NarL family, response regulator DesR